MKTQNAVIESVSLGNGDGRGLDAWLHLKKEDGWNQGFGGYALYLPKTFKHHAIQSPAGHHIHRVLEIADVHEWSRLVGRTIRVRHEDHHNATIQAIGHIIKDDWYCPSRDFALEREEAPNAES